MVEVGRFRQSRIYARDGVDIDRSTMVGWVDQGDALVEPLAAALGRYTLADGKVHADDTPVPVLDPGRGRTKTGRLWVYVRDDRPCGSQDAPAVWFQYSPDRGGEHPREHLKRYRGILRGGGGGYEAQKRAPGSVAEQALKRIAKLYEIEAGIRGRPPNERRRERLERAAPLLEDLHAWLSETLARVSAKSDLAQAIGYTLTHWKALTRYCDDGRIEIDNNAAERALRGVSLGRNYANCSLMRTRPPRRWGLPSVQGIDVAGATSHDHSDRRNCISPFGGRYRAGLISGGLSRARARSFIAKSASTYI